MIEAEVDCRGVRKVFGGVECARLRQSGHFLLLYTNLPLESDLWSSSQLRRTKVMDDVGVSAYLPRGLGHYVELPRLGTMTTCYEPYTSWYTPAKPQSVQVTCTADLSHKSSMSRIHGQIKRSHNEVQASLWVNIHTVSLFAVHL